MNDKINFTWQMPLIDWQSIWIKVETQKPEEGQEVIGYGTLVKEIWESPKEKVVEKGIWKNGKIELTADYYTPILVDVTHWMPSPTKPQ